MHRGEFIIFRLFVYFIVERDASDYADEVRRWLDLMRRAGMNEK